jgi:two-component system sensor histidine kinase UhpB
VALGISQVVDDASSHALLPADVPTAEEVQRHLSREVHDQVAQPLIGLVLEIRSLRTEAHGGRDITADLIALEETARQVLRHAREMMVDLRERNDLRINLIQALKSDIPVPPGHDLNLQVSSRWPRQINGWAAFNLLRIAQQAVANALRHGRANRIDLILDVDANDRALVVVLDDGAGIDDAPYGFGLVGMRERAVILGGTFSVHSREAGGTRVEIRVPVERIR